MIIANTIAGVDEVGRGALCGSVIASAVILNQVIQGLKDSKKLTELQRNNLADKIQNQALAWSIGLATVQEIETINILQASLLAMQRAINNLTIRPQLILIDGNHSPTVDIPTKTIIKGDNKIATIAAASIIAKVTRDQEMYKLHKKWPEYGFNFHKGYPTKNHLNALKKYGPLPVHRKTFSPINKYFKSPKIL